MPKLKRKPKRGPGRPRKYPVSVADGTTESEPRETDIDDTPDDADDDGAECATDPPFRFTEPTDTIDHVSVEIPTAEVPRHWYRKRRITVDLHEDHATRLAEMLRGLKLSEATIRATKQRGERAVDTPEDVIRWFLDN